MTTQDADRERLEAQIRLLVQTEQRLYRTQTDLNQQLVRTEALARWALGSPLDLPAEEILARGVALFAEAYACDWVIALELHGDRVVLRGGAPAVGEAWLSGQAAAAAWLQGMEAPARFLPGPAVPRPLATLLETLAETGLPSPYALRPDTCLLVTPIRVEGRVDRVVLASAIHPPGRPPPDEATVLPFLQLLAAHVATALQNAGLNRSLVARTEQLSTSLAHLESAQQELVQSGKMEAIGQLAGGVAHDFNNLLTVILNHAHLLAEELPPGEAAADVATIIEAGTRAANLAGQLLAFARRQRLSREVVDLNLVVPQVGHMLRRLIGEDIEVRTVLAPEACTILGDRTQVEQVLLNLVVNARDAMPRGGVLTLTTRAATAADRASLDGASPAAFVAVEVVDTGTGMDDETRARIFEPFFTTKGSGKGTGMGLAVVYGIVTQSGGMISVRSRAGEGTTFTVYLPRPEEAVQPGEPERTSRGRVLLVEDEEGIRAIARRVLHRAGFDVVEASNGEEALVAWRSARTVADVVVTDVVMPRMGGVELAHRLRAQVPDLEVIFMSGYSETTPDGPGDPARRYLPKPFTPADLVRVVDAAVTRAAQRPPRPPG